ISDVYVCIGTKSVESDIPIFGTDEEFKSTVVHEFIHPFIMHYCLKYRDQLEKYAALYKKNEDVYRRNGCPDWFSAMNELLTRTVEIRINSNGDEEKAAKAIEDQSKNLGFSTIPVLYRAFDRYYSAIKRKENNLDKVFPDIVQSLDESEKND
ncbi:MAG TPA: DUF4932 domain-containing protein, partial [Bacteroidota bacterium]|nr:DUF4932 domain-containing protein [Bacteroidota bacterium]